MKRRSDQLHERRAARLAGATARSVSTGAVAVGESGTSVLEPPGADPRVDGLTVTRGHLVPAELHRRARRAKLARSVGARISWSDVMVDGVTGLVDHPDPMTLVAHRRSGSMRLVQATIPAELDGDLAELHLVLNGATGQDVSYEDLWAAAIEAWIVGPVDEPEELEEDDV